MTMVASSEVCVCRGIQYRYETDDESYFTSIQDAIPWTLLDMSKCRFAVIKYPSN